MSVLLQLRGPVEDDRDWQRLRVRPGIDQEPLSIRRDIVVRTPLSSDFEKRNR
jgi:hypothetical protein